MPAELVGAGENVSGGFRGRGRPQYMSSGGPWDLSQPLDIGSSNSIDPRIMNNDRTTTSKSADPRCECIGSSDPRTEVR